MKRRYETAVLPKYETREEEKKAKALKKKRKNNANTKKERV